MTRYVAFLRAINVGGRTVRMAQLVEAFEGVGLARVETFIASGNVIFESGAARRTLTTRIESCLRATLGYDVATFLRTDAEVREIAGRRPFPAAAIASAGAYSVGMLAAPLGRRAAAALKALETENDAFAVRGQEMYWLCQTRQSESTFSNTGFEKALGVRATFRGMNTMTRLTAKYPPTA
jgi:uncharacterized protein (DUF1697 family)